MAADLQARRIFTVTRVWMAGTVGFMTWASLLVGVVLAVRGSIRAGVVYLVLFYAAQVSGQLIESFLQIRNLSRGLGRAAKLVALVNTTPEVKDAPGATELVVSRGSVRFDTVSFSYRPERPLLEDFNLELQPGEHVGVVGPSGGGKSTITRLVLRLMDLTGGRILIDGQDIATCTQASVRRAVSYVPQDPQMLHRSIAENIWYGQEGEADLARVRGVAVAARVDEFVDGLPEGYDTIVGERGLKLSGGQRQRVAIAQAMLKGAPLLHTRRGHQQPGLGVGALRPGGVVAADGSLHGTGRGPPAVHNCPPGPHRRGGCRAGGGGGYAPRPAPRWYGRRLPAPVGAPVRRFPERLSA